MFKYLFLQSIPCEHGEYEYDEETESLITMIMSPKSTNQNIQVLYQRDR